MTVLTEASAVLIRDEPASTVMLSELAPIGGEVQHQCALHIQNDVRFDNCLKSKL